MYVPCSKRIMQDCRKALDIFGSVYKYSGRMVPGLANRNGHRNFASGRNTDSWGGARIKILLIEEVGIWLHEDTASAKNSRTAEILAQTSGEEDSLSGDEGSDDE